MKKMVIVLVVALSSGISEASADKHVAQEQHSQQSHKVRFRDADQLIDEYTDNCQSDIDEYDQHVCDDVQPPAISNAQMFLTSIAGKLLVYYVTLQQTASIYFQELKDLLNQWFNNIS